MAIAMAGIGGSVAYASPFWHSNGNNNDMASAMANRFNLNSSDVQKFFDEQRILNQAERQTAMLERHAQNSVFFEGLLAKAISDGKITETQKNAIILKKAEIEAERKNWIGKTPEEIFSLKQAQTLSLKQWATDNKIPAEYLPFGWVKGGMMGFGGRGMGMHGFGGFGGLKLNQQ